MAKFEGKTVLITGAASGIGYATAEAFGAVGCRLILTDINQGCLEGRARQLRDRGAVVVDTYAVDVANKAQVDEMAGRVLSSLGSLDILINNAGIGYNGDLADTTLETWRRLVDVNFWGPLYHVYAFLPSMKARGQGHIVNVSSGQAFFRLPSWGAYASVKLALSGFSEILHFELARNGIRVTTVYPFLVKTEFYHGISAATRTGKLSMLLLPYCSDSPAKVASAILRAVEKEKMVEKVSLINDFGYFSQLVPPISRLIGKTTSWLLTK
ncbi:MAG: SDR family oxidoreductase [Pseudomonadota bacterium]